MRRLLIGLLVGACSGEVPGEKPAPVEQPPEECKRVLEPAGAAELSLMPGQSADVSVRYRDTCAGPLSGVELEFSPPSLAVRTGADGIARMTVSAGAQPRRFPVRVRAPELELRIEVTV